MKKYEEAAIGQQEWLGREFIRNTPFPMHVHCEKFAASWNRFPPSDWSFHAISLVGELVVAWIRCQQI